MQAATAEDIEVVTGLRIDNNADYSIASAPAFRRCFLSGGDEYLYRSAPVKNVAKDRGYDFGDGGDGNVGWPYREGEVVTRAGVPSAEGNRGGGYEVTEYERTTGDAHGRASVTLRKAAGAQSKSVGGTFSKRPNQGGASQTGGKVSVMQKGLQALKASVLHEPNNSSGVGSRDRSGSGDSSFGFGGDSGGGGGWRGGGVSSSSSSVNVGDLAKRNGYTGVQLKIYHNHSFLMKSPTLMHLQAERLRAVEEQARTQAWFSLESNYGLSDGDDTKGSRSKMRHGVKEKDKRDHDIDKSWVGLRRQRVESQSSHGGSNPHAGAAFGATAPGGMIAVAMKSKNSTTTTPSLVKCVAGILVTFALLLACVRPPQERRRQAL